MVPVRANNAQGLLDFAFAPQLDGLLQFDEFRGRDPIESVEPFLLPRIVGDELQYIRLVPLDSGKRRPVKFEITLLAGKQVHSLVCLGILD